MNSRQFIRWSRPDASSAKVGALRTMSLVMSVNCWTNNGIGIPGLTSDVHCVIPDGPTSTMLISVILSTPNVPPVVSRSTKTMGSAGNGKSWSASGNIEDDGSEFERLA